MTELQALRAHLVEYHGVPAGGNGRKSDMRKHFNIHLRETEKPLAKPHSHPQMLGPSTNTTLA